VQFVGLPLSTLLPLGAAAASVVIFFYILKLRRRPVAVPFARLWHRVLRDKEATSLFSQLKRLLSLLLQLALLALLLLALGDPRPAASFLEGRSVVVLLDASASMKATDVAPSRIEVAKEEVKKLVRGLSGTDRMLIAQMDGTVTPLSTMTEDVAVLEAALTLVKPTDTRADFPRALRFAADALRGQPKPEVVVVSDGALGSSADGLGDVELGGAKLSYLPIGKGSKNAAITAFSVRRYPLDKSRYEVMLEVTNTSPDPMDIELSLLGDGALIDLTRLRLDAGERLPRFYPSLSGASRTLEAKLALAGGGADELPADDRAYALLPERRRARVLAVTPGNMYLEAALLLDEYLDVTTVQPANYPPKGSFDVTIFDGVAPPPAPSAGSLLYLAPTGTNAPVGVGKVLLDDDADVPLGFDELDEKHPILRYTSLGGVNVSRATALEPREGDTVVGKSAKGALLVAGRRSGVKFVALGFDVRDSDFALRIAWPLFLLNVIGDFVEEDASYISSFVTGRVFQVPAPSTVTEARLLAPDGSERLVPVENGRAVFLGQQAGFYTLTTGRAGAEAGSEAAGESSTFAANLSDPAESAITPQPVLEVAGRAATAVEGFELGVRRELWIYFLAAVLGVTAIEWLTYHRRVTV
jgi:Ca-activated chloride channel family protein